MEILPERIPLGYDYVYILLLLLLFFIVFFILLSLLFIVFIIIIILAKSYPYSKAVHIPCQNGSGNLENNERPLMMRIRLCDPCQGLPCHVLSCPIAHV